jgi:thiamine pyrophosphokinase
VTSPAGPVARVAVVVGGGGPPAVSRADLGDLGADPLVIAADSGLEHALTLGLDVERVVGDMDSVDPAALAAAGARGVAVDRHPAAKDATDLDLALDAALAESPARVVVVTGAGDRLDHALAVALAVSAPGRGPVPAEAWVGPARLWVVRDEAVLEGRPGDLVSLLPVHGPARGVTTDGLLYPLRDEDLAAGTSRGVSNEWVKAEAAVRVRGGILVAVAPGSAGTHWARSHG